MRTATTVAIGEQSTVDMKTATTVATISTDAMARTVPMVLMADTATEPMVLTVVTVTAAMATLVRSPLTRVTRTVSIPARMMHNDGRATIRKDLTSTGMGTATTAGITSRPTGTVSSVATRWVMGN